MILLENYGWDSFFEGEFELRGGEGQLAGRVLAEQKNLFRVVTLTGEMWAAPSGRMYHSASDRLALPAVGDWVICSLQSDDGRGTIHGILPRKTQFVRKVAGSRTEPQIVAANFDVLFLMMALNEDYNLRRLERYLTLSWESGAVPVILLSKADLCGDVDEKRHEVEGVAFGAPVEVISVVKNIGIGSLKDYFRRGRTVALLGSSGVGKSTLINSLVGKEIRKVQAIRESDGHGRHTTTARELILLPPGGLILDSPGMRELQLWGEAGGVSDTFEDIGEIALECRFRDCGHVNEPNCAVRSSVENGRLDAGRYQSYLKLRRELDYLELRRTCNPSTAEKIKWKKLMNEVKKRDQR